MVFRGSGGGRAMTSLRPRSPASAVIGKRALEGAAADFGIGPAEQIAGVVPVPILPHEADNLACVYSSGRAGRREGKSHFDDIGVDPVNGRRSIDKECRRQRIAPVFTELDHFHFSPRPPAHIAEPDTASPHSCSLLGLSNGHVFIFLTQVKQLTATRGNPPSSSGRSAVRPGARRRAHSVVASAAAASFCSSGGAPRSPGRRRQPNGAPVIASPRRTVTAVPHPSAPVPPRLLRP